MHLGLLLFHHPPGRRGNKELFVDAVSEAVGDAACVEERVSARCEGNVPTLALTPASVPVMALRISVAAASLISSDACSLYQAVCGVQIRLGASFRGPWAKLEEKQELVSGGFKPALMHQSEEKHQSAPERLRLVNIQSCSSYPALFQGLSESFLIYQTAACRIDQERTLTHLNTHIDT